MLVTFTIKKNTVVGVSSDKNTISVYEGGAKKERHQVTFTANYKLAYDATLGDPMPKWCWYNTGETAHANNLITGENNLTYTSTSEKEGEWQVEAFANNPDGTNATVKAIYPKITKAYWADGKGAILGRTGYGHKVYFHIVSEGLVGETLKLQLWQQGRSTPQKNGDPIELKITENQGRVYKAVQIPEETAKSKNVAFFCTLEKTNFTIAGTQENEEGQLAIEPKGKEVAIEVRKKKQITSLKLYEEGNKLHTGIVKYGDTVTVKVETRNLVDETLTFMLREAVFGFDKKLSEKIAITIDNEGKGEATFTVPESWKDYGDPCKVRKYYLKEKESGEEFPRAYYVANPNKTDEENKKNSRRIEALMLKVTDDITLDDAVENESAVILGEELPAPEKKTLEEGACPDCGKKHVDLRDSTKWQTQFDTKYGNKVKQSRACWKACYQILANYGVSGGGLDYSKNPTGEALHQVGKEVEKDLIIDNNVALKAKLYIDEQLNKGKPILVGVDHTNFNPGYNNDKTTDHFLVIVGKSCEKGKEFYLFYEVGTSYKNKGVSDENKLFVKEDNTLRGSTAYSSIKKYTVTQIRENK